ncbi:hypothetical protein LINGRAHAP2_LOCUS22332, partial [Linum grandiflorum]
SSYPWCQNLVSLVLVKRDQRRTHQDSNRSVVTLAVTLLYQSKQSGDTRQSKHSARGEGCHILQLHWHSLKK